MWGDVRITSSVNAVILVALNVSGDKKKSDRTIMQHTNRNSNRKGNETKRKKTTRGFETVNQERYDNKTGKT